MKSQLLARQIRDIFGEEGESQLKALLDQASASHPQLVAGIQRLLTAADDTYANYGGLQLVQAELSGDTFSDWNLQTGHIESGRKWKVLLGYTVDELDNTLAAWQRLLHPDDAKSVQTAIAGHGRAGNGVFAFECRLRAKAGDWKWLLIRGQMTARDAAGEPVRMLVMHRDIHLLKEAEAQLIKAKEAAESATVARGAFLANMSHEIRTPMNGIIGMTDLLLTTPINDEQRDYLNTLSISADSLLTLINDILDVAKIEAGKLALTMAPFNLRQLIDDVLGLLAPRAFGKGIELLGWVEMETPESCVGDLARLRQVLLNLLGNAIKFTEHGGVSLSVRPHGAGSDPFTLQFAVQDTGIGIPADKQASIFEPFTQADGSTTRRFGGTGLGLTISRNLVELMGGELWVESRDGEGSTFYFTVKLAAPDPEEASLPVHKHWPQLEGLTALIYVEQPLLRENLQRIVATVGLKALTAASLDEARAHLTAAQDGRAVHFMLFDVPVGELAVLETTPAALRGLLPPPCVSVPLLSPNDYGTAVNLTRRAGYPEILVKPTNCARLAAALEACLQRGGDGEEPVANAAIPATVTFKAPERAAPTAPSAPLSRLNILLAEDNAVNQKLALALLHRRGHTVTVVDNGRAALETAAQNTFDLVLMDVQMPEMGGLDATRALREREIGTGRHLPVIAMTAHAMKGDEERCLEAGMDDYIAKPVQAQMLYAVIDRVVARFYGAPAADGVEHSVAAHGLDAPV